MNPSAAEPLHDLIRSIRRPATLRELMAACLRSIYSGDPFAEARFPSPPHVLIDGVIATEEIISGIRCIVYKPRQAPIPASTMIYMHGGGFVIGCTEDVDYTARKLCLTNQMLVISVNYRLSPEHLFPAALDDCLMVADAAREVATKFGASSDFLFIGGDSAGGNLAASLASCRLSAGKNVDGIVLLAPWLDMHLEKYDSYNQLAPDGIVFDAAFMGYARAAYTRFELWADPRVSPIEIPPSSLPPTLVICGTADPLIDQVVSLERKSANHKQIKVITYDAMPHCFYSFPGLFAEEEDCYERIAGFIKERISEQQE